MLVKQNAFASTVGPPPGPKNDINVKSGFLQMMIYNNNFKDR